MSPFALEIYASGLRPPISSLQILELPWHHLAAAWCTRVLYLPLLLMRASKAGQQSPFSRQLAPQLALSLV